MGVKTQDCQYSGTAAVKKVPQGGGALVGGTSHMMTNLLIPLCSSSRVLQKINWIIISREKIK